MTIRSFFRLRYLPILAAAVALAAALLLHASIAQSEDAGAAAVAAQYDAAVVDADGGLAITPADLAAGPAVEATVAPAPVPVATASPTAPTLPSGMAHGLMWASVLLSLVAVLRTIRARLEPTPGEPDPTGWRARAIPILSSVIALLGAGADVLTGLTPWHALVPVALTAIAMTWSAFDPPRGSARKVGQAGSAKVTVLLVVLVPVIAAIAMCTAACCHQASSESKEPTVLDRAADVAIPLAKGYLCGQPAPPSWAPDAPWMADRKSVV